MRSEEKVKQVYPNAWYRIAGPTSAEIKTGEPLQERIVIFYGSRDSRKLWAEAWRRIEAAQKGSHDK